MWEFTYDANGMRTRRTHSEIEYQYIYNGSQLTQLTVLETGGGALATNTLYFTYSADGTPLTVTSEGETYFYVTNIQGDVIAILDHAGRVVCRYIYDAWGNVTTDSWQTDIVSDHNPLRYRGYVYDQETQLYYLQSRYYNPKIGRFLNADAFAATGQGVLGNNMFAYCGNNPVANVEIGGFFWDTVFDVVSLCVSVVDVIKNPDDPMAWLGVAADVASLVIPFATGGGAIVKAATKADDVADAVGVAKVADNIGDVGQTVITKGPEIKISTQIKADDALSAWDDYLGPGQTNYNRFSGEYDMNRIFSADGTKSIRFGNHEMESLGTTKAHFHYEEWIYNPFTNTVRVDNYLQRLK